MNAVIKYIFCGINFVSMDLESEQVKKRIKMIFKKLVKFGAERTVVQVTQPLLKIRFFGIF